MSENGSLVNPYVGAPTHLPRDPEKRARVSQEYLQRSLDVVADAYKESTVSYSAYSNIDQEISENVLSLLRERYFAVDADGERETSWKHLCRRVARTLAATLVTRTLDYDFIVTTEKAIFLDMLTRRFLFNSPCLFTAGTPMLVEHLPDDYENLEGDLVHDYGEYKELRLRRQLLYKDAFPMMNEYKLIHHICSTSPNHQLMACFVIGVDDDLTSIFDSVKKAGIISKTGGGVGLNFSHLREAGASISNGFGGKASGPLSFMKLWDTMGSVIVQGGKRRAAMMGMLNDNHYDIEAFIDAKVEDGVLPYFNISVSLGDDFMKAVEADGLFDLVSRVDGQHKPIKARELWQKIGESAWKRGDPGVFFRNNAQRDNILSSDYSYTIECSNPCGEVPSSRENSCNLGSIDVAKYSSENDLWHQAVRGTFYLDLVIDATSYPIPEIEKNTKAMRPVGLGIMGLADYFIKHKVIYGSSESVEHLEGLMWIISAASLFSTLRMADVFGPATVETVMKQTIKECHDPLNTGGPLKLEALELAARRLEIECLPLDIDSDEYEDMKEDIDEFIGMGIREGKMRNSRRLSIAPTGTLSIIAETSSGLEPNFGWAWNRKITKTDGTGTDTVLFTHPLLTQNQKERVLAGEKLEEPYMVTVADLYIAAHLNILLNMAPYIDQGLSKTISLPNSATVEDVLDVYMQCYKAGVKGVTVYRDGSRSEQPIQAITPNKEEKPETHPRGAMKERNSATPGFTTKTFTPWGSLYATLNAVDNEPFEAFLSIGKSGSEVKAMTEALSRVISIALRSGTDLANIIATLKDIGGSEMWVADFSDNTVLRSLPDAIAKALEYLLFVHNRNSTPEAEPAKVQLETPLNDDLKCPDCGAPMVRSGGCPVCLACGYGKCKS